MSEPACHTTTDNQPLQWYALWVFRGLTAPITTYCNDHDIEIYQPVRLVERFTGAGLGYREEPVIPSLLFVKTVPQQLVEIKRISNNRSTAYCLPGTSEPAAISDRDMEIFMLVVKRGAERLEQVDFPIDKGDRVRVTDGIFKGAEGYIRRIHGSRRFVVAIEGVVAVALTHIPRQFLEPATSPAAASGPQKSA